MNCANMYLDVGGVLVRLISCCLQLLTDPSFNFVHIPAELLQGLRFTQLGAFFYHLGLQPAPPLKQQNLKFKRELLFFFKQRSPAELLGNLAAKFPRGSVPSQWKMWVLFM